MTRQVVSSAREGSVLVIRLCSPQNRNALTTELLEQLSDAVEAAERDRAVRSVFLTGEGPTFCSGGDLKILQTACDPWPVHRRFSSLSRWLTPLITLDKPVVVGVRGHALGGGLGLALTGDAAPHSRQRRRSISASSRRWSRTIRSSRPAWQRPRASPTDRLK